MRKAKEQGIEIKQVLTPYNSAKAMIGLRYSTQIPLFLKVVDMYGARQAFQLLNKAETIDEVKKLVTSPHQASL